MNSAVGNFDSSGVRLISEQTPENSTKTIDVSIYDINWCKSKIMSLEDEIKRLKLIAMTDTLKPVVAEQENIVLDVTDYGVTQREWETFCSLCIAMVANGASLFELQQRLMGLVE